MQEKSPKPQATFAEIIDPLATRRNHLLSTTYPYDSPALTAARKEISELYDLMVQASAQAILQAPNHKARISIINTAVYFFNGNRRPSDFMVNERKFSFLEAITLRIVEIADASSPKST